MTDMMSGGCACGAVRFRISAQPVGMGVCHCRACQYASGGAPAYVALVPRIGFEVTKGEPKVYASIADSGNEIGRAFCAECGTPLYSIPGPLTPFYPVKMGALDDPSGLTPSAHIYTDEKQPWHALHEGVPAFPKMPPMGPPA